MTEKAEPTKMQVAAGKAIKTAKTATTLAKAHLARESNKHGGRWHWVDFPGPNGRESAGIVDIWPFENGGNCRLALSLKSSSTWTFSTSC